jgi:hypothetical protein
MNMKYSSCCVLNNAVIDEVFPTAVAVEDCW